MLTFSAKLNNEQSGTSAPQIRLRDLHKKKFFPEWIENGIFGVLAKLQKSVWIHSTPSPSLSSQELSSDLFSSKYFEQKSEYIFSFSCLLYSPPPQSLAFHDIWSKVQIMKVDMQVSQAFFSRSLFGPDMLHSRLMTNAHVIV